MNISTRQYSLRENLEKERTLIKILVFQDSIRKGRLTLNIHWYDLLKLWNKTTFIISWWLNNKFYIGRRKITKKLKIWIAFILSLIWELVRIQLRIGILLRLLLIIRFLIPPRLRLSQLSLLKRDGLKWR